MATITLHNYQAYLLDLAEGTLSDEMAIELELFLIQHPNLNDTNTELVYLNKDIAINYKAKPSLHKTTHDLVSDEQFVAYIENQLSQSDKDFIEKSCAINVDLGKELDLFKKSILLPDESIAFPNKNSLKKRAVLVFLNQLSAGYKIAASFIFILGLLFLFWPINTETPKNLVANVNTPTNNSILKNTVAKQANHTTVPVINNIAVNNVLKNQSTASIKKTTINQNNVVPEVILNEPKNNSAIEYNELANHTMPMSLNNASDNIAEVSTTQKITLLAQEEDVVEPSVKKGFWRMAKNTLATISNFGVKSVNANETTQQHHTSYDLTIGGLTITHSSAY